MNIHLPHRHSFDWVLLAWWSAALVSMLVAVAVAWWLTMSAVTP